MAKLFVVVRADLPIGSQLAQVVHAAHELGREVGPRLGVEPDVVVLHAASVAELERIYARLVDRDVSVALFREPDRSDEPTALAAEGDGAAGILRALPLAFGPKCSHCGAIVSAPSGVAATHDNPPPCRAVCPGSGCTVLPAP